MLKTYSEHWEKPRQSAMIEQGANEEGPVGNAVVIKNGYARRIDPRTGSDKGSVGGSGAIAAASDGDVIAVVYKDGRARRYDANTGSDKGSVGSSGAIGCNVSGGVILLNYKDGRSRRYDAHTGSDKGSA
jgi:hypothetical protein